MSKYRPLIAVVGTGAAAAMIFNILPVFLGKAADSYGLTDTDAGWLGTIYLAGFGLSSVTASLWVHRVRRGRVAWASFAAGAVLLLFASTLSTFTWVAMVLCGTGLALGTLYSLSFVLASEYQDATRAVGIKLGGEVALGSLLLFLLPVLVYPLFGFAGMLAALAVVLLVASLSSLCILEASGERQVGQTESSWMPIPAMAGLLALFLFTVSQSAIWSFAERAGVHRGLEAVSLGSALSFAVLTGGLGSLLAAAVSNRAGRMLPILCALIVYVLAVGLFIFGKGFAVYALAVNLLFLVWLFALPYFVASIADADDSGRAVPLVTACFAFGSMAGPVTAGALIGLGGYDALYLAGGILSLVAFSIIAAIRARSFNESGRS